MELGAELSCGQRPSSQLSLQGTNMAVGYDCVRKACQQKAESTQKDKCHLFLICRLRGLQVKRHSPHGATLQNLSSAAEARPSHRSLAHAQKAAVDAWQHIWMLLGSPPFM